MIIYTCITNDYVQLPTKMPEGATYVCFGVQDPPDPWIGGLLPDLDDPVRTSRYVKILCPFQQPNVYIDASKIHLINDKFIELSKKILDENDFFVMQHPCKHTYLEECAESISKGWVDEEVQFEFAKKARDAGLDFGKLFSPLCTILWRKDNTRTLDTVWWEWYNKGGVRDQLAFTIALQLTKTQFNYQEARSFLNQFTDAEPDGIWWDNRGGDYKYVEAKDPDEAITKLCKITGLNKRMRYRAAIFTKTGQLILGDRSKYWPKNHHALKILSGL